MSRGGRAPIEFAADDPDDDAVVEVFAEPEGNLAGAAGRILIATSTDDDGIGQTQVWDTGAGVAFGSYRIVVRVTGPGHDPVVATAPGTVTLGNVAYARTVAGSFGLALRPGATAAFPDGETVVGGRFSRTAVFGSGEPGETELTTPESTTEMYLARYRADGTLAWARRDGGSDVSCIEPLRDGSFVVFGTFSSSVVFGVGEANETRLAGGGPFGTTARFIARYGADGSLAWAKRLAPFQLSSTGFHVAAGDDDTVVLSGSFAGTLLLGEGEPNETVLVSTLNENDDFFVACFAGDGGLMWAQCGGGTGREGLAGVAVFRDGACVVVGEFDHVATFGRGEPDETNLVSHGATDIFVARYAGDGRFMDAHRIGGPGIERAGGIAADPDGSSVLFGSFSFDVLLGAGQAGETRLEGPAPAIPFLARFGADGELAWARALLDRPFLLSALFTESRVRRAADGSIIVTTTFDDTITLGAGEPAETTLPATGVAPFQRPVAELVARYESDGTLLWARAIPQNVPLVGIRSAVFPDGSVAAAMAFGGTITLGEGDTNETTVQGDPAIANLLVVRFNGDGDF